jgi:hypothetical protein
MAETVARICRADLIVTDDVGLLPVAADATEALAGKGVVPLIGPARGRPT